MTVYRAQQIVEKIAFVQQNPERVGKVQRFTPLSAFGSEVTKKDLIDALILDLADSVRLASFDKRFEEAISLEACAQNSDLVQASILLTVVEDGELDKLRTLPDDDDHFLEICNESIRVGEVTQRPYGDRPVDGLMISGFLPIFKALVQIPNRYWVNVYKMLELPQSDCPKADEFPAVPPPRASIQSRNGGKGCVLVTFQLLVGVVVILVIQASMFAR